MILDPEVIAYSDQQCKSGGKDLVSFADMDGFKLLETIALELDVPVISKSLPVSYLPCLALPCPALPCPATPPYSTPCRVP
jgi:hypothetical protein